MNYRGEIGIIIINLSSEVQHVLPGEKIAQLVVSKVEKADVELAFSLDETDRGENCYGSSGRF